MHKAMDTLQVQLRAIRYEAPSINTYEFQAPDGSPLPGFTAGAHIELHLPNGLIRSYSLCNAPTDTHRYVIGVNRDPASRGGSSWVHEMLRVGTVLTIGMPINNFPLSEGATHTVFVAGGIGITPIMSMIARLEALERSWELHYCTRTREATAFINPLREYGSRVQWHHDGEPGGQRLEFTHVLLQHDDRTHFYCCGPAAMLNAFEAGAANCGGGPRFHVEYFAASDAPATSGGFSVQLARSGRLIRVNAGKTILDALIDAGIDVSYSCSQGVCGTCETRVLEGVPDHRDMVLTKGEQEANRSMMICCSGSRSECLVLDL